MSTAQRAQSPRYRYPGIFNWWPGFCCECDRWGKHWWASSLTAIWAARRVCQLPLYLNASSTPWGSCTMGASYGAAPGRGDLPAAKYPVSVRQWGPQCHRHGSLHFLSWPSNVNLLVPLISKILYTSLHIQSPEKCQCKMCLPNEIKHLKFKHALPHYLGLKLCILPDYVAFLFVLSNWEKLTDLFILHLPVLLNCDVTGCFLF